MSKGTILIVEDDSIIASLIEHRLNRLGYQVGGITSSGEDAVAKAQELHPDLVLMDIQLRGKMDGITAAKMIKEADDIPVVYLTSYSDEDTLDKAKKTEPEGFIVKPFTDDHLRTSIDIALYKHAR